MMRWGCGIGQGQNARRLRLGAGSARAYGRKEVFLRSVRWFAGRG